jgi:hypothetical protein
VQGQQRVGKGQQRGDFRQLPLLAGHEIELVAQVVVEQHVIHLAFLRQPVEVVGRQLLAPRHEEGPQATALCR